MMRVVPAVLAAVVALAMTAGSANAARGDNFGLADVNVPGADTAPAFPGTKAFWAGTCDLYGESTSNGGVGTAPGNPFTHCIDQGTPSAAGFSLINWSTPPAWRLDPVSRAAAHPDASTTFWFRRQEDFPSPAPDGEARTILAKLPPGVVGNPNAVPKCSAIDAQVIPAQCPPETQVGVTTMAFQAGAGVDTWAFPVYNVEPRKGNVAELLIGGVGYGTFFDIVNVPIVAKVRSASDFGIDALVSEIPNGIPVMGQSLTVWGVPWAASHDVYRSPKGYCLQGMPPNGLDGSGGGCFAQIPQSHQESWGPIEPFFTNPTECAPTAPVTDVELNSWQSTSDTGAAPADSVVTACDKPPFDPDIQIDATTTVADGATGLKVELNVPQRNDPPEAVALDPDDDTGAPAYWKTDAALATAHLDQAVVTLPDGISVNPSGATGLQGCSDEQLGLGSDDPIACPDGSKIGAVTVDTPLLEEPLSGAIWLREPRSTDPASGEMFRMAIVVENADRGLLLKIPGSAVADPKTGQLTATFDDNPRVPFTKIALEIKGGPRGVLAMPQRCGAPDWSSTFTPWTSEHDGGGQEAVDTGAFAVNSNCGFGFNPSARAGMDQRVGGGGGTFSLRFTRNDGEQWFQGVSVKLPTGLHATVRGVPLCTDAQASANACPAGSRIGTVDASAGSGDPFVIEQKGSAYLTEGYKGAPYGLAVSVPVEAGPFRGQYALKTVVVRQALYVDPETAQVTAVSDPLPDVWHGIPLRVREVTVNVDRPRFMNNPTDCSPKSIETRLTSVAGAIRDVATPFQATDCGKLAFKPRLALQLTGKRQVVTGKHPGLRARLTQPAGQANIRATAVRLPLTLALDPNNANGLCEFAESRKADPQCPASSIIGRATAVSPLLERPLTGPVYFAKNIRISSTGNQIRTLPSLVVKLRGEVALNLRAKSSVDRRSRLVSTFPLVPDARVTSFALNLKGGKGGILAVTGRKGTICGRQVAEADFDGHNGRQYDNDIRIKTPCKKRATKTGKRRR